MERQYFIDTISDLRSTIESLRLTVATLQKTVESLRDGERRHRKEALKYEERISDLVRQCEYLESQKETLQQDDPGGDEIHEERLEGIDWR